MSPVKTPTAALTKNSRPQHDYTFITPGVEPDKKYILDLVLRNNVQFVNMQFTDILGILKSVTMPVSKLEDAIDHNVWFDGSSIEGFARIFESDMYLRPDLSTFAIIPWTRNSDSVSARIICDIYMPDGTPFKGDPRYILKKQIEEAKKIGFTFCVGPELEFFLFKKNEKGEIVPLPHDKAGYFDQSSDLGVEIRKEMTFALKEIGIDVEALHHEVAEGQHEIDFKYDEAIRTADNAVTLRYVLKAIASLHGLYATFMPKPIAGINGSGMHVHQSLFKGSENVFYDENDEYKLSDMAKSFIAGQLTYIRDIGLLLNPLVNSYKRLVVGYEAPVYVTWAHTNRSALIRIPRFSRGKKNASRCELRCPDPSANPYLAFAGMLAAGLRGIKEKLIPPEPVEENIYRLSDEVVKERKIGNLAENLHVALHDFENSRMARDVLGDHAFEGLIRAKKAEWDAYRLQVTKWEVDEYLEVY